MSNKVIEMLTSHEIPREVCVMGNEGVARAAVETAVSGVFAYPGTPSTEISMIFSSIQKFQSSGASNLTDVDVSQNKIYFEYSVNEKVALEKAIACAIGNKSAMACMKNVGLNVALDPLMTIPYQTINAPLVLIICDDPGCHSSSNEQDSRHFASMASIPLLDPSSPEEAYSMTKEAFAISAHLKLPVIIRLTTRISHGRGDFSYGPIASNTEQGLFNRDPVNINVPARTSVAHANLLKKLEHENLQQFYAKLNKVHQHGNNDHAVIVSGITATYFTEQIEKYNLSQQVDYLKIGLSHPFPEKDVLQFLQYGYKKVLILEELDPVVEDGCRIVAQKNNINVEIVGKQSFGMTRVGEYSLNLVHQVINQFLDKPVSEPVAEQDTIVKSVMADLASDLPIRPPALCVGCPHRATYYAMKLALSNTHKDTILCGDIGCMGLGALPPLQMIDTVNHMGMSISMAQGLNTALASNTETNKVMALIGDGTFFHSGIPSLLNAVYTKANLSVIIFDNRTIAMTGLQENPGTDNSESADYSDVDLQKLLHGLGIKFVKSMDPFDLKDTYHKLEASIQYQGVSVLISKSPCVILDKTGYQANGPLVVDSGKCKTCANHDDSAIHCSRSISDDYGLARAKAKMVASEHIPGSKQLCPANICNHGFFNAILADDHQSALELVRDKMLFARTCGDICHRPCEGNISNSIPIKQLKHYVSSNQVNFTDHTNLDQRKSQQQNGLKVAVVGSGPAGLSAAYDLVLAGYSVVIYEKEQLPGGVLQHQIPDFRMDKKGLQSEIRMLNELGVKFEFGVALGEQINLNDLSKQNDAVILAIGVGISSALDVIDGAIPASNRYNAMDFLSQSNDGSLDLQPNSSVVVIGGGNSAMDAARAAKKHPSVSSVTLSCIESEDDIPAFEDEVEEAVAEGIKLIPDSFVDKADASSDAYYNLQMKTFADKTPLPDLQCNYVITAIGQRGDATVLKSSGIKDVDELQRIKAGQDSRLSSGNGASVDNIFVAGDIKSGHHMSLIGAIAGGKQTAIGVRKLLEDYPYSYEGDTALDALIASTEESDNKTKHQWTHDTPSDEQLLINIKQFDLHQTCERCNHCIDNFGCPSLIRVDGKITIEQSSCIRCGLCIDVCPNGAINWQATTEVMH